MNNAKIKFIVKIDDGSFKVLKCAFKDKRWQEISRFAENLPGDMPGGKITGRLKEIFKELKLKNEPVIVAVGRRLAVTRYLSLPSMDKREVAKMIEFWVPRCLPYPLEELSSGWAVISKNDGYSKIMLSVIQRKELERISGFLPVKIEQIESVFLDAYGLAARFTDSFPVMRINVDDFSAQIVIAKNGKLLFSRAVSLDFSSPGAAVGLLGEIDKSIQSYQRENIDVPINRIFLYGKAIEGLQAKIESALKIEVKAFPEQDMECLGLLDLKDSALNLATSDFLSKKEDKIAWLSLKRSMGLAAVLLLLVISGAWLYIKSRKIYLKELEEKVRTISDKGSQLDQMYRVLAQAGSQNGRQPVLLDLLRQLHGLLPASITLETFSYQKNKEFVLKGRADSLSDALNTVSILDKSGGFSDLKVNYADKANNISGESVDFQITGHFKNTKKI
jgi:Tfp pilus assembly protein PilN